MHQESSDPRFPPPGAGHSLLRRQRGGRRLTPGHPLPPKTLERPAPWRASRALKRTKGVPGGFWGMGQPIFLTQGGTMKISRPSPSMVVAGIALFVSLGGTSIAAVNYAARAGEVDGKSAVSA